MAEKSRRAQKPGKSRKSGKRRRADTASDANDAAQLGATNDTIDAGGKGKGKGKAKEGKGKAKEGKGKVQEGKGKVRAAKAAVESELDRVRRVQTRLGETLVSPTTGATATAPSEPDPAGPQEADPAVTDPVEEAESEPTELVVSLRFTETRGGQVLLVRGGIQLNGISVEHVSRIRFEASEGKRLPQIEVQVGKGLKRAALEESSELRAEVERAVALLAGVPGIRVASPL